MYDAATMVRVRHFAGICAWRSEKWRRVLVSGVEMAMVLVKSFVVLKDVVTGTVCCSRRSLRAPRK